LNPHEASVYLVHSQAYGMWLQSFAICQHYAAKSVVIMAESVGNPDVTHCSMMSPCNLEVTVCLCPIVKVNHDPVTSLGNPDVTSSSVNRVHAASSGLDPGMICTVLA